MGGTGGGLWVGIAEWEAHQAIARGEQLSSRSMFSVIIYRPEKLGHLI